MAKRVVVECDLTKQEVNDPDELVTIEIKRKGKRGGRKYEISPEAATILEQQLVAGSEAALGKEWYFTSKPLAVKAEWNQTASTQQPSDTFTVNQETTDESWVAAKKAQLKEAKAELNISEEPPTKEQNECIHMNKGPIQTTIKNNERYAYRICRECHKQIPEKRLDDRKSYLSARPPKDTRLRDYGE